MTPKVLVIEDEPSIHDLLEIYLEKKGCQVFWTELGQEGVALAKSEKPNVILIDVHLPDMDGMQALCLIREFDKEAKLFLFSGLYDEAQEAKAISCGGSGFIDKALGVDAVLEAVLKALSELKLIS
jgi:DNA-binding response OmpR family regulator